MGTTFSTLADHAVRMNMTHETMIGVILAIPFFLKFYQEALNRYLTKEGQIRMMERIEENHQHQYQVVPLLKHRTLLRGTMPDLVPSSKDSVSTAVASNTARAVKAREMVEPVDLFPVLPSTIVTMEQQQLPQETFPNTHSPSAPGQTFAVAAPLEAISFHPNDLYQNDHSKQHLEEQSFLKGQSDDDLTEPDEGDEPHQSTADYLESVAQALTKKARHADHADKVGIANALMELGNILWKDRKNQEKTLIILKYAETVQRIIIDETIAAVASAMEEQGKYHETQGNKFLAHVYGNMAKELQVSATPMNLKKSIELHHQHKVRRGDDPATSSSKALKSLNKKLDRRLKRASAEAVPLVQNFKTQAQVNKSQASYVK
jgi:hypothetical protein